MIAVFHKVEGRFAATGAPHFPEGYEMVASVDTSDIDDAYRLTNTIEQGWWKNKCVTANFASPEFFEVDGQKGTRSTSVGDVLVTEEGIFECARFGWDEVKV